jgi:hypothetical protein
MSVNLVFAILQRLYHMDNPRPAGRKDASPSNLILAIAVRLLYNPVHSNESR